MMLVFNRMTNHHSLLKVVGGILLFSLIILWPKNAWASTLYLSPGGSSINLGGTLAVQVRLAAGGDSVNGVSAFLSYPSDKLDVVYVNYGGSFSIAAEGSYGGGSIRISRGNISAVSSGDVNVATVGFRGKSLGLATVTFVGGSAAPRATDSSDSLNLGASRGGSYSIVPAAPQPSADTTPAKITNLTATEVATNSATITWNTDKKTDSNLEYGLEKDKYLLTVSKPDLVNDHSIQLEKIALSPGTKLHFHVKSKGANGVEAISGDSTIQLKGYKLKLKLTDSNNNPLKNVKVALYSEPRLATTDNNGEVSFNDLTAGKHLLVISLARRDLSIDVMVNDNNNFAQVQQQTSKIETKLFDQKSTLFDLDLPSIALAAGFTLLIGVIIIIVLLIVKKKKSPPQGPDNFPDSNSLFGNLPPVKDPFAS